MAQTEPLPAINHMWNFEDPAGTAVKFRSVLPEAERSGNTEYYAELLTQIARTESLQDHFDEADSILDRAEKLLTPETPVARARYLLERGRVQNSAGHPERAMPFFSEAYDVALKADAMGYAIDAVHMLGIAAPTPKDQVDWNLRGIAMAEAHEDSRGWLNALYNNIGESYAKMKDYANAEKYFTLLLAFQRERRGFEDMYTKKDVARMQRLGGHPERCLASMQPLLDSLIARGEDDGYIRAEVAESLEALGRHAEAAPHFQRAYDLLEQDKWFVTNEANDLQRYRSLGAK